MHPPQNQVLTQEARKSRNFYHSDLILQNYLSKHLSDPALHYIHPKLEVLGQLAATEMDQLSMKADKKSPTLRKRNEYGENVNDVIFHPAYGSLVDIAARSEMFFVKYDPELRKQFVGNRHQLGYAAGQIYAMSELGVYCPLCMTDGAAHLIDRYASPEIKKRLLPKLSALSGDLLWTGAMFLTEKSGGSDVGRNLAQATQVEDNVYQLSGEKWFCSNVNADVMMVLARTGSIESGIRGLSLFLVEKTQPDGSRNPMNIVRLKDKMGVRSMATGEVVFEDTIGILLGDKKEGFKAMAEMINISRTYNSIAALGGMRRALIEAWEYLNFRIIFGKTAVEHALIRQKFHELIARYLAEFLLTWRAIRAMDASESGQRSEQQLHRLLIPMAKWRSAAQSVYIVRECMELMGGNGYIEDFVMPKIFRDVNVLPIWEGSGNIIVLDILRATSKTGGMELVTDQIRRSASQSHKYGSLMNHKLDKLISLWLKIQNTEEQDIVESTAKPFYREIIHLYQMALMIEERDKKSKAWIDPALVYMASVFDNEIRLMNPPSKAVISAMMGWKF